MKIISLFAGMRTFVIIWLGQLVSTLGSGLTGFALGVWIYQETGSTTLYAFNMLANAVPNLLLSPLAGALADRWDRRLVMIMSDAGAGLGTLAVAILALTQRLEVWHVYVATAFISGFSAFQWPAYSAATTLMVPKEQLGRAGGMVQIGEAVSQLISPALAGGLLVFAGLQGVILTDFATFLCAIATLAFVRFPRPAVTAEGRAGKRLALAGSRLRLALYPGAPGAAGAAACFCRFKFPLRSDRPAVRTDDPGNSQSAGFWLALVSPRAGHVVGNAGDERLGRSETAG